ncbi:MAG TPA: TPM domain-containing protein [Pyrinomonadaceae bacterium]|jgi:uncharacterized protein
MKRLAPTRTLCLVLLCLLGVRAARAQATQSPLPAPQGFVNDYANVIDPATEARLETILTNLRDQQNIEFAVVTVPTTGDRDIFDYTLAVARGWGIGAKDGDQAGLLLLVAINDRKYFTQVSRHLEGDLPDGVVGQIQRERLVPPFKQGNYSKGITDTAETYVATLAEKRGFSIAGLDQSRAYRPPRRTGGGTSGGGFSPCCIGLIILIVIIMIFSSRGRGGGGGCGNLLLLNTLFNVASSAGRSSSGWRGGGFGGSSGGGGGFGGFGGGGSFGGGGAGGSW